MNTAAWPHISASDTAMQYGILETIRRAKPLNLVPDSYVEELKDSLENAQSATTINVELKQLCSQWRQIPEPRKTL
jgi:hypothetical protein